MQHPLPFLLRHFPTISLLLAALWVSPAQAQTPNWQGAAAISNSTNATSANGIFAMATDAGGNVYVTGTFADRAVFNNTTISSQADASGFIAKWNPITRRFVWVVDLGAGQGLVTPLAVAVRGADVYVAGSFSVMGLNWGNSAYVQNAGGFNYTDDGFVVKLTDSGNSVSYGWLQRIGGTGDDSIEGLAVSGNSVYLSGSFSGTSAAFGGSRLASLGGRDGFVAKLTDAGTTSQFSWAQRLGGTGVEEGYRVAAANGNVYVTGTTTSAINFGGTTLSSAGGTDGYIAKFADAGSSPIFGWVQPLQGAGNEILWDVVARGTVLYVAGSFTGAGATFGNATLNSAGGLDGMVGRLTDVGSTAAVTWAQRFGGPFDDEPQALNELGGKVYVAGYFGSGSTAGSGLATGFGNTQLQAAGGSDAFLARLSDTGSAGQFDWALAAGSPDDDYANAVTLSGTTACTGGYFVGNRFTIGSTVLPNLYPSKATSFVASLIDPTLPTRDAALQQGLMVFPNPARNTATVRVPVGSGPAVLSLLDALGHVVRIYPAALAGTMAIDLTGLTPGVYALRVQANRALAVRQLAID